jgi:hypothetical protein
MGLSMADFDALARARQLRQIIFQDAALTCA